MTMDLDRLLAWLALLGAVATAFLLLRATRSNSRTLVL